MTLARHIVIALVRAYQIVVSPVKMFAFGPGGACRFTPSCSEYAIQAVWRHGLCRGGWLALKRICRCHPWGPCGHDPVPDKSHFCQTSRAESKTAKSMAREPNLKDSRFTFHVSRVTFHPTSAILRSLTNPYGP